MVEVIWTSPAFLALEALPFPLALGLFRKAEMLKEFPEMGGLLPTNNRAYAKYRQLVFRKSHRVIYEFDEYDQSVYILAIQDCRQKLPSARDLKRVSQPDEELPLE